MSYGERSTQLALESSVAVLVLLGTAPGDCEFIPLKPRAADAEMCAELKERWPGRGLRSVGIVGLVCTTPRCVFKEPLEPEQLSALADAFLAYLSVLFADSFAEWRGAAIQELDRERGELVYDWHNQCYRYE